MRRTRYFPPDGYHWASPEQEYVEGPEVSAKQLAARLGAYHRSVERWITAGSWREKRHKFQAEHEAITREAARKAAIKQADVDAADWVRQRSEAPRRHAQAARALFARAIRLLQEGAGADDLQKLKSTIVGAVAIERQALGLRDDADIAPAARLPEVVDLLGEPFEVAAPVAPETAPDGVADDGGKPANAHERSLPDGEADPTA